MRALTRKVKYFDLGASKPASTIDGAIDRAIALSKQMDTFSFDAKHGVKFTFNDVAVKVDAASEPEDIIQEYYARGICNDTAARFGLKTPK